MKILIIDDVHGVLPEGLEELGYVVDYHPGFTREELIAAISGYEGLVVRTKTTIDKDVLSHAAKLKFIARAGAGLDNIDTETCDHMGIMYFNAGEANADAVGEHTIGMLLCVAANIVRADREVRKNIWDREGNRGFELNGKTVALIGYGNTGRAVAQKLSGFSVKVLAYDKYLSGYSDAFARESSMEEIFAEADVVSFHVPLTPETMHMADSAFFARFTKKIVLLNLSRGKVVNTVALVKALSEGRVLGCALDVLENEKLSTLNAQEKLVFDYFVHSAQTVLTPHIAGWTVESYRKISKVLLQKIKELPF